MTKMTKYKKGTNDKIGKKKEKKKRKYMTERNLPDSLRSHRNRMKPKPQAVKQCLATFVTKM